MHSRSPSLIGRALLALLLTLGFYGLALAISVVLLFIPFAELYYLEQLHFQLAVFCLVGAGIILWSILPRRDRFIPPGPLLEPGKQTQFYTQVADIAQKTGQRMPSEIYVIPDVNAFVMERGGWMGIGSRRVMGVGLILLQALSVQEFRAVLAHEFGHFYGGDTRLGPWVYRTRGRIVRTILSLGQSWLRLPFQLYGKLFLRITNGVSRAQEFTADQLAARIAGPKPLIDGLQAIHGAARAFDAFWQTEYVLTLNAGYRPSLVGGFAMFMGESAIGDALKTAIDQELESAQTNPYDSHPCLRERINALQGLPEIQDGAGDEPALSLLADVDSLEQRLFVHLFGREQVGGLKPIRWQDAGEAIYVPAWERAIGAYREALVGVKPPALWEYLRAPDRLVAQLRRSADRQLTQEELGQGVSHVTGAALAIALLRQGWTLVAKPGADFSLQKEGQSIQPFKTISSLACAEMSQEMWLQLCDTAGIADTDLGSLVEAPLTAPQDQSVAQSSTSIRRVM